MHKLLSLYFHKVTSVIHKYNLKQYGKKYYSDYIQGRNTDSEIGKIDFTQAGLETVSKQPLAGKNFMSLQKDIKEADYISKELPSHHRDDNIKAFHILKNQNQEFLIGEMDSGNKYYMSKK